MKPPEHVNNYVLLKPSVHLRQKQLPTVSLMAQRAACHSPLLQGTWVSTASSPQPDSSARIHCEDASGTHGTFLKRKRGPQDVSAEPVYPNLSELGTSQHLFTAVFAGQGAPGTNRQETLPCTG